MFQKTTLSNGLRVVTSPLPHSRSVSLVFLVGAGSRYEGDELAGVSHLVEHMLFKGTRRYPSARQIAEAIEGVGGVMNGGTDRETTIYWAKVARHHFGLALDVLADMLRAPLFDADELERERQVILGELAVSQDTPQHRVELLLDGLMWPDHPLGRDVAGTRESVASLGREAALEYLQRQYSPGNTVLSVAGDVQHEEVLSAVEGLLGDWAPKEPHQSRPADHRQERPHLSLEYRRSEQAYMCVALRGLSSRHPDRFVLGLLSIILGEGMSSRLFQELREKKGLVYDIHSYPSHFQDTGALTVSVSVAPERASETLRAVIGELARLKEGVTEDELRRAQELSKGRLLLRMEDSRNVAGWVGGQEMILGQVLTPEEVVAIVEAVSPDDVARLASSLIVPQGLNVALVGPYRSQRRFEGLLAL